ncbi:unnamed protein product [Pelagomonas calceolata]|uniref:Histone deacetylase domain-containing protein n=1 Tax=Pelagomonas calceolata TaxID=35677 RepID=A0A8J2SQC7_9STRA|nr:unnamed protein product [Pelagomonas calceolata]
MLFRRAVATIRCGRLFATQAEMIQPAPAPPGYSSAAAGAAWTRQAPPFVWHPELSIPWPVTHRFAMWKFDDLRRELIDAGLVTSETELFAPRDEANSSVLDAAIRRAHDASYVEAIEGDSLEVSLWRRIGFVARPDHALLMRRTRLEIAGTLRARDLALKHGLACQLGGGTHHAHKTYGSGYTIYNDLAVTALDECARSATARVLIVDLDVHQGDGTAQILQGHDRCYTWSVHCSVNFPFGFSEKHAPHLGKDRSSLDTALERGSGDAEMLDAISVNLPAILDSFEPTLVLYDAGADAHEVDGLGHLELTDAGMLARDTAVLRECASRSIPVATVIGGGYDRDRRRLARRHATIFHAARAVWRQFYMAR